MQEIPWQEEESKEEVKEDVKEVAKTLEKLSIAEDGESKCVQEVTPQPQKKEAQQKPKPKPIEVTEANIDRLIEQKELEKKSEWEESKEAEPTDNRKGAKQTLITDYFKKRVNKQTKLTDFFKKEKKSKGNALQ